MWSGLKWACGLVLLTLCVYWDGRDFDYVWDDALYVQQNADVQAGLTAGSVRRAFAFQISNWQPLVWLSLMADVEVFGFRPRSFHTTNLCLHAANAVLLFCWLRKLTGREFDSAFVAAVFAVHPLHVESVEWISGRKDVLSMFFGLLTLLAWERYLRVRSRGQLAGVCLASLASLMSKQLFVTLPVLLLMLDFWPLKRVPRLEQRVPDEGDRGLQRPSEADFFGIAKALLVEKLPLFVLAVVFSGLAVFAQQQGKTVQSLETLPIVVRVANAIEVTWLYLGKALWPTKLIAFYPHPGAAVVSWRVLWELIGLMLVTVAFVSQRGRRPYLIVGWLWYLIALLPMIGIIQVGDQQMADRYAYLPLIGVYWAATWWTIDTFRTGTAREMRLTVGIVALAMLAGMAHLQVGYWRNHATLFGHLEDVMRSQSPPRGAVLPGHR